jgi:hypothetical protein
MSANDPMRTFATFPVFADITLGDLAEGGLQVGQFVRHSRNGTPVLYTTGRGVTDGMIQLFVEPNAYLAKLYTHDQLIGRSLIFCAAENAGYRSVIGRRRAKQGIPTWLLVLNATALEDGEILRGLPLNAQ